jgi:hypothetical protein
MVFRTKPAVTSTSNISGDLRCSRASRCLPRAGTYTLPPTQLDPPSYLKPVKTSTPIAAAFYLSGASAFGRGAIQTTVPPYRELVGAMRIFELPSAVNQSPVI